MTSRFKIFPAQLWMAKSRILIKFCSERSCVPSQCEKSSLALRKRISKAFRSGDWLGSQEAGKAFNSNWKSAPALWPPTTRAKSILAWEYIVFSNLLNSAEGGKNFAWILWQPKSEAKLDTIDSQRDTRTCIEHPALEASSDRKLYIVKGPKKAKVEKVSCLEPNALPAEQPRTWDKERRSRYQENRPKTIRLMNELQIEINTCGRD